MLTQVIQNACQWQANQSLLKQESPNLLDRKLPLLLKEDSAKSFLIELLDTSFRSDNSHLIYKKVNSIINKYERLDFFSFTEVLLLGGFQVFGKIFPTLVTRLFLNNLRKNTLAVLLKDTGIPKHALLASNQGYTVNWNNIGEFVLGDTESERRIGNYIACIQNPAIKFLSIKTSNIFSQTHPVAFQWNIEQISCALEKIFRHALKNPDTLITLDMEHYRDLEITLQAFKNTLSQKQFLPLKVGVVIQAYLPEALTVTEDLVSWAIKRVNSGGNKIKLRIVKGANLATEKVESSQNFWQCPIYTSKVETDANFKSVLNYCLQKDLLKGMEIGIATHNIFDLSWVKTLLENRNITTGYVFEMLQGMNSSLAKIILSENHPLLMYTPYCKDHDFNAAIAYLVRRLDEITTDHHFLRYSYQLKVGSEDWKLLQKDFLNSITYIPQLNHQPMRKQNRVSEICAYPQVAKTWQLLAGFTPDPTTDFTRPTSRKWTKSIYDYAQKLVLKPSIDILPMVGGYPIPDGRQHDILDNSSREKIGTWTECPPESLSKALLYSEQDSQNAPKRFAELQTLMSAVADQLCRKRAHLIGVMIAETGKTLLEADQEISEAIDFLNYYPVSLSKLKYQSHTSFNPKGIGIVISPWNFPLAIPCGGIVGALCGGNQVLFKPSKHAVWIGHELARCFWEAGVSSKTLQFIPCQPKYLMDIVLPDSRVKFCIFTGSTATAKTIQSHNPNLLLSAETGGKNATIVTWNADHELAIQNILDSAFSHSGQKCSATSIVILEKELFRNKLFKEKLKDAVKSLIVGSAWQPEVRITPLIQPPSAKLRHALDNLSRGEEWLVPPSINSDNPNLMGPCVKWGVNKKSSELKYEYFAPFLCVVEAKNLKEAIQIANSTSYGLTSGLESLDETEQQYWSQNIQAGNLYINRPTSGAIVLRQPFGGIKGSKVGSGFKAGGPNYVLSFLDWVQEGEDYMDEIKATHVKDFPLWLEGLDWHPFTFDHKKIHSAVLSYAKWKQLEYATRHDPFHIEGESNEFYYKPYTKVLILADVENSLFEIVACFAAAKLAGCQVTIYIDSLEDASEIHWLLTHFKGQVESPDSLELLSSDLWLNQIKDYTAIRWITKSLITREFQEEVLEHSIVLHSQDVASCGRIEMLNYYYEQTLSNRYHRYGHIPILKPSIYT